MDKNIEVDVRASTIHTDIDFHGDTDVDVDVNVVVNVDVDVDLNKESLR